MRYLFGIIGVIAALGFVTYAAVTSYHTAAAMTTQFQELAGWAAAGMVCWEALGALYVQQCWRNGSKLMALGGAVLVLAASVYLLRLDLRFHVAGQSDMAAAREVGIENRDIARTEHEKATKRRDELQKLKSLTGSQQRELSSTNTRIADLEKRLWGTETVSAGGVPEAGWASRMLSGVSADRVWWADAFMVAGLLFWALARMLALPVAVASMQMAAKRPAPESRQESQEAREASPATLTLKNVSSPVLDAIRDSERDLIAEEVLRLRDMPVTPQLTKVVTPPEDPGPKGGRGPVIPPSAEVGQPAKEAPAAEPVKREVAIFDNNVVDLLTPKERRRLAHEASNKKKPGKAEGSVIRWLDDCCSQTPDKRVKATSQECRRSYIAWCEMKRLQPVGHKQMSRIISVEVCRGNDGARGPRNGKGAVFPGLLVAMPVTEPLRRRA